LATAAELTEFKDSLTVESIDELSVGLEDKDWKVKTRAILGLEIVAEQYGLPAVAKVKNQILSLNGAPQASLRTAAQRFYAAIKDVVPLDPAVEISAFSFMDGKDEEAVEENSEGEKMEEDKKEDAVPEKVEDRKEEMIPDEKEKKVDGEDPGEEEKHEGEKDQESDESE
jgi:hypothetical protein